MPWRLEVSADVIAGSSGPDVEGIVRFWQVRPIVAERAAAEEAERQAADHAAERAAVEEAERQDAEEQAAAEGDERQVAGENGWSDSR